MYDSITPKFDFHPPKKGMCTEIIIKALQQSFYKLYNTIPPSLHLDPGLCPPSVMMLSLIMNKEYFNLLGTLFIKDYRCFKII